MDCIVSFQCNATMYLSTILQLFAYYIKGRYVACCGVLGGYLLSHSCTVYVRYILITSKTILVTIL